MTSKYPTTETLPVTAQLADILTTKSSCPVKQLSCQCKFSRCPRYAGERVLDAWFLRSLSLSKLSPPQSVHLLCWSAGPFLLPSRFRNVVLISAMVALSLRTFVLVFLWKLMNTTFRIRIALPVKSSYLWSVVVASKFGWTFCNRLRNAVLSQYVATLPYVYQGCTCTCTFVLVCTFFHNSSS